ncbi:MAG: Tryptophanyl-tRNA synthetase [Candidatus Levybacteria bacterium GW2011_GWA2_40_8]|nr:MAG: Tryptophanyl-tRNA synthetase [Candidatus Levybacteria bacterium GW2011_GWA2_40_8]
MAKPIQQVQGKRVYSGIRATGRLHLGNYFGAVKGMLELQDSYDCIFSVVDLHAITTPFNPKALKQQTRDVVLDFLAAGLDPKKCLLEIQSKVPQHVELSYLLSTIYPVARLEDLPTYKDKKAQYPKYVNMGLLYYPVLMAADILLYKAELVPVGIDQEPHLEVAREIARKFNQMFPSTSSGQVTFPEPQRFATNGEYVMSLTGEGKMGKSTEGSYINLTDDLETIKQRLATVPTDSGVLGGEVPEKGGVATLFQLLRLFNREDLHKKYTQDYSDKKIRYSEMKEELASVIFDSLSDFRRKRKEFEENPEAVDKILEESLRKCRDRAEETMKEVRSKMGLT